MTVRVVMAVVLGEAAEVRRGQKMPRVSPPAVEARPREGLAVAVAVGPW